MIVVKLFFSHSFRIIFFLILLLGFLSILSNLSSNASLVFLDDLNLMSLLVDLNLFHVSFDSYHASFWLRDWLTLMLSNI